MQPLDAVLLLSMQSPDGTLAGIAKHAGVQSMLVANGVVALGGEWEQKAGVSPGFASLDEALAWCEKHFTEVRFYTHFGSACDNVDIVAVGAVATCTRCITAARCCQRFQLLFMYMWQRTEWLQVAVAHGFVEDTSNQNLTLADVLHMHLTDLDGGQDSSGNVERLACDLQPYLKVSTLKRLLYQINFASHDACCQHDFVARAAHRLWCWRWSCCMHQNCVPVTMKVFDCRSAT